MEPEHKNGPLVETYSRVIDVGRRKTIAFHFPPSNSSIYSTCTFLFCLETAVGGHSIHLCKAGERKTCQVFLKLGMIQTKEAEFNP